MNIDVTYDIHVGWMPDMSAVKLHVKCEYMLVAGTEQQLNNELNQFIRFTKENCLREIANDSINRIMVVNPERHPKGGGMYGQHSRFKAEIMALNHEDATDVVHVGQLDAAIRNAFWKHVAAESKRTFDECLVKVNSLKPASND
jgi:hypothetical protein